jgi:hypothetical protein
VFTSPPNHRLKAFILSTLATPVPSHDITRELSQFLRDSFSVSASAQVLFSANSQRSLLCHGLGEVYQMLTQHQAHGLLFIISLESSACSPLCLSMFFLVSIFCISFPRMVLDLSCSFCQKGTQVSLVCQTLRYFGLTFFSQTMLPFMGVVEYSTTSPSFIN